MATPFIAVDRDTDSLCSRRRCRRGCQLVMRPRSKPVRPFQISPLIASQRASHSVWLDRRLAPTPVMLQAPPRPWTGCAITGPRRKARPPAALRRCTVELTFGILTPLRRFPASAGAKPQKRQGRRGIGVPGVHTEAEGGLERKEKRQGNLRLRVPQAPLSPLRAHPVAISATLT
jgi:hypothetical protein